MPNRLKVENKATHLVCLLRINKISETVYGLLLLQSYLIRRREFVIQNQACRSVF
jgi:hypothetical protein